MCVHRRKGKPCSMSCEASGWCGRKGEVGAQLVSALQPSTVCHPGAQTGTCVRLCLLPGARARRAPLST